MSADDPILLIPYGEDPLHTLADLLLDRHAADPLELSRQVVLFQRPSAAPRFRRLLLARAAARGLGALLPPEATTLGAWARRFADPATKPLGDTAREWLLHEALCAHPEICRRFGTWPLIDSLLGLFDELNLNRASLPDGPEDFRRQLAAGYGPGAERLSPFEDEANLVHTLWRAWREHLAGHGAKDHALVRLEGLARSLDRLPPRSHVYLAGPVECARAELDWLTALAERRRLTLLLHGQDGGAGVPPDAPIARLCRALRRPAPARPPAGDARAQFLDRVYAAGAGSLPARAQGQRQQCPESPVRGTLVIHEAPDAEQEARAVELQVRRFRLDGCRNIGIVTNDRKLARRVRALLERAEIALTDAGGWRLSTTSAATALARWLECLERDFPQDTLADLLGSPFVAPAAMPDGHRRAARHLEREIIRRHNLVSGLGNYRRVLRHTGGDLDRRHGRGLADDIARLLAALESAAQPLQRIMRGARHDVHELLEALRHGLQALGIAAAYAHDEAGEQILDTLETLRAALAGRTVRLSWAELHRWLRRELERRRFQPPLRGFGVELMSFAESRLYRFDGLVIAGALREHLPGPFDTPPFFNDGVRTQLGLPSLAERHAVRLHDFRRLLEAAPRIVITLHRERDGERLVPSPWVERLRAFHLFAYGDALADAEIERLARSRDVLLVRREAPRPGTASRSVARLPEGLFPERLSATSHQRLIDCPYQFFGADGLGLRPEEEVREALEKLDYGRRVHRILQAFHAGAEGLPGPWHGPLSAETLPQARALLQRISAAEFAADTRRSFLARGWLHRWEERLPDYLRWQAERERRWRVEATEVERRRVLEPEGLRLTLSGRLDRVDRGTQGTAIVDYKTGAVPPRDEVLSGERVQLPHYALLLEEPPNQSLFLALQEDGAPDKVSLEDQELELLVAAVRERLLRLRRKTEGGARLPAWGDAQTCRVCPMEGLCRKELWSEEPGP